MEGFTGDLFATKGIEYLLVIGYLLLLTCGWRLVFPKQTKSSHHPAAHEMPEGFFFHQGHTWAALEHDDVARVGVDDFAQRTLGLPVRFELPEPGTPIHEGETGWTVRRPNGDLIPLFSPVDGVVVAVNEDVVNSPGLVNTQPYDDGWLLKVHLVHPERVFRNLMTGRLAHDWMNMSEEAAPDGALDELLLVGREEHARVARMT